MLSGKLILQLFTVVLTNKKSIVIHSTIFKLFNITCNYQSMQTMYKDNLHAK